LMSGNPGPPRQAKTTPIASLISANIGMSIFTFLVHHISCRIHRTHGLTVSSCRLELVSSCEVGTRTTSTHIQRCPPGRKKGHSGLLGECSSSTENPRASRLLATVTGSQRGNGVGLNELLFSISLFASPALKRFIAPSRVDFLAQFKRLGSIGRAAPASHTRTPGGRS
jgi:hypothetical protein